jgi:hypothetical protein
MFGYSTRFDASGDCIRSFLPASRGRLGLPLYLMFEENTSVRGYTDISQRVFRREETYRSCVQGVFSPSCTRRLAPKLPGCFEYLRHVAVESAHVVKHRDDTYRFV